MFDVPTADAPDLDALVERIRALPGVRSKAVIGAVSEVFGGADWWAGAGDDGAVVADDGHQLVVGGEAMLSAFVEKDPYGAGVAAVVANVNDLAAMGARPLAIVDTIVGTRAMALRALEGLRWASDLYRVPVVGGHLTESDGAPALSAFGLGRADAVLSANHVEPGQDLILASCLEGEMRPDFLFFRSLESRRDQLSADVRLLAEVARAGAAVASKDVSMAGLVGSLAMLLEANRLGVEVDVARVPVPEGVALEDWLCCFPSFAFLITADPERTEECRAAFRDRGLSAEILGTITDTGRVQLRSGDRVETVFDLEHEAVTGLSR